MRILYVTACLPFGPVEAFIVDELDQLRRTNEILIVPRSPGRSSPHGAHLAPHALREELLSASVLYVALRTFLCAPIRILRASRHIIRSGSLTTFARNLAVLPKALWLAAVARKWRAHHIHCHWAGTTATMALVASRVSGIPWSLTTHRSDIVANNILGPKLASASFVRAISKDGRRMLIERGAGVEAGIRVLPIGVNIPERAASAPLYPVVLCPADLLEVKGHRYLLEAWRTLLVRGVHAQLWLAGQGPLQKRLEQLAQELEIESSVKFLGTIPHASMLDFYTHNLISLVVLASIDLGNGCHEGIPVALVEAMSYGVPVIATKTGAIPELILPGTGILVPPRDPSALANSIEQILADTALAQQLGSSGRAHIQSTRNVIAIAAELESRFRDHVHPLSAHGVNPPAELDVSQPAAS